VTSAQLQASIARHARFLTPAEQAAFGVTEAERLAGDRVRAIAKENGVLARLEAAAALRMQLREQRA
jgi:hypothetical protein